MIKQTWKRLNVVRKNDIDNTMERLQEVSKAGYPKSNSDGMKPAWSFLGDNPLSDRSCKEGADFLQNLWTSTIQNGFNIGGFHPMGMMQNVPLYGSPVSLLWPLGGISVGTFLSLAIKAGTTPEEKVRYMRMLRRGGTVAAVAAAVLFFVSIRQVPESPVRRYRTTAKWPWKDEDAVADLDPMFEAYLDQRTLPASNNKPQWVRNVFTKLTNGNDDVQKFHDRNWHLKVIDSSIAMLLCFVVPRTHNIWMTEYYLNLVENDAQLAYVIGHELSHVICEHAKDYCFIESFKEFSLLAGGLAIGWFGSETLLGPMSNWQKFIRGARFFAISGVSCVCIATLVNLGFVLPFRRQLELEADIVGFKFSSKACFNPKSVPDHWLTLNFPNAVPQYRSTHPNALVRRDKLIELQPRANEIMSSRGCK